jgi:hypothetical protein
MNNSFNQQNSKIKFPNFNFNTEAFDSAIKGSQSECKGVDNIIFTDLVVLGLITKYRQELDIPIDLITELLDIKINYISLMLDKLDEAGLITNIKRQPSIYAINYSVIVEKLVSSITSSQLYMSSTSTIYTNQDDINLYIVCEFPVLLDSEPFIYNYLISILHMCNITYTEDCNEQMQLIIAVKKEGDIVCL